MSSMNDSTLTSAPMRGVGRARRPRASAAPGLVHDGDPSDRRSATTDGRHRRLVQAVRPLAAADDEDAESRPRRVRRSPDVDDPPRTGLPVWSTPRRREVGGRGGEADADPSGEPAEEAVGRAGHRVLLEEHRRHAAQPRREHAPPPTRSRRRRRRGGAAAAGRAPAPAARRARRRPARRRPARCRPRGADAPATRCSAIAAPAARPAPRCPRPCRRTPPRSPARGERLGHREAREQMAARAPARDQDRRARAVRGGHPASRESARSTPISASATSIAEPPYDTNGSARPFVGRQPRTTPMLIAALEHDQQRRHAEGEQARRTDPGAGARCGSRGRRAAPKSPRTRSAPIRPSSSPITEKMKSVCASGR